MIIRMEDGKRKVGGPRQASAPVGRGTPEPALFPSGESGVCLFQVYAENPRRSLFFFTLGGEIQYHIVPASIASGHGETTYTPLSVVFQ